MLKRKFSCLWLPIAVVSIIFSEPVRGEQKFPQQTLTEERNEEVDRAKKIKRFWGQLPTVATPQVIPVTKVEVNATDSGLEIILVTQDKEQLQVSVSNEGNSYIADIPNAQLQLLSGDTFRQENPAPGILSIVATNLDSNRIRVRVTGDLSTPAVEVFASPDKGLIFEIAAEEQEIEIIVTGEKTEANLQAVPISITPITPGEIEDADITSVSDISRNVPNFTTFSPSRNFVTYSIRGLSNFNFFSRDPVAFYVDDVPYDYTGFLGIEIPDIERVEVLRGPQATLYGRNAQAGVVNIITRKPSNFFEFRGTAGYASYNNPDVRASLSTPFVEDELFFLLSGSYQSRDGYTENTFLNIFHKLYD